MSPLSLRSDLMAKNITRNQTVINIITSALVKSDQDYIPAESSWPNGSRSDLVLEPKSSCLGLPPIIVEFQHSVNKVFMKRATEYALQAFKRYDIDPIVFIVCMNTVLAEVEELTQPADILGCQSYPCHGWAADCLIMSKKSLSSLTAAEKSNPFSAFGLFLTQSTSVTDLVCDDPTMEYLKTLALDHYASVIGNQVHIVDFVKDMLHTQNKQYEHLLTLAPSQSLQVAIRNAQTKQQEFENHLFGLDSGNSTPLSPAIPSASSSSAPSTSSTAEYQRNMSFISEFKEARIREGKRRMNWLACFDEGRKNGLLLSYKNANSLKHQFQKYEKSQNSNK
ncbi:hypothetical protein DM01DRAFT_1240814 [Hesseltinella vesiculosa]|uniref:Uncharacterized protein n=1 Tax=Hesseltinella vesiculosa TaxID=101127 RepID=A0A1X2GMB4_9FUNG|nr:hypothetical protein DM01DRAFT_1240814 [Hesseltinella vesiculosa]